MLHSGAQQQQCSLRTQTHNLFELLSGSRSLLAQLLFYFINLLLLWICLFTFVCPGSHDAMSYCLDINSPLVPSETDVFRLLDRFCSCLTRPIIFKWTTTQVRTPEVNAVSSQADENSRCPISPVRIFAHARKWSSQQSKVNAKVPARNNRTFIIQEIYAEHWQNM